MEYIVFISTEIIVNFLEVYVGYKFIGFLLGARNSIIKLIPYSIIYSFFLLALQNDDLYSSYIVYVSVAYISITACFVFKKHYLYTLTLSAIYLVFIIAFSELNLLVLISLFTGNSFYGNIITSSHSLIRVFYSLAMKLVQFIIVFTLISRFHGILKYRKVLEKYKLLILLICIISYIAMGYLANYIIVEINSSTVVNWLSYLVFLILCLIAVASYLGYKITTEKKDLIELKNIVLEKNYDSLKLIHEEQSKTAHDLKNHLNILRKYVREQRQSEALTYLEDIIKPFNDKDMEVWTGNDIIDFIVNSKSMEARSLNVRMLYDIHMIKEIKLSDRDINCILSNLIDNAIEAATKLEDDRWVRLSLKNINDMFIIKIENNYGNSIIKKRNKLLTDKEDKKIHGLGIKIVKETVKKYDGYIDFYYDNLVFKVTVGIPI